MLMVKEKKIWDKYKNKGPWYFYIRRYLFSICLGVSIGGMLGQALFRFLSGEESPFLINENFLKLMSLTIVSWVVVSLVFIPFAHHEYKKLKEKYS